MKKEIRGKRIILREQREEDVPFYTYWFNQPQVMFQCGFEKPTTEEEMKTCITVNHKSKDSVWFTITDLDGNLIGETGLLRMFPAWHQTDLTIIIPHEAHQGKGYGTEAIRLLMDYAFGDLGFHRLAIGVVGFNTDALRFYKKNGFKKEGIQEDGYYYHYEYHNFIMMRILKEEFLQLIRQK